MGIAAVFSFAAFSGCTVDAEFKADVTEGAAPLTVHFTNQTIGATSFTWYFGEFTRDPVTREIEPTYTYTTPGVYTVSLLAIAAGPVRVADNTEEKRDYITVLAPGTPDPDPNTTGTFTFAPPAVGTSSGYSFTGRALVADAPNGPVVAGNATPPALFKGGDHAVGFLAGVNPALDALLWDQVVPDIIEDGPRDISLEAMAALSEGYVLVGSRSDALSGAASGYVYRADSNGDAVWAQSLGDSLTRDGGPTMEALNGVLVRDGDAGEEIMVVGASSIFSTTVASDIYLASLAADGALRWETTLTVPGAFVTHAALEPASGDTGGFLIAATDARSFPSRLFVVLTAPIAGDPMGTQEMTGFAEVASGVSASSLLTLDQTPSAHAVGRRIPDGAGAFDLFIAGIDETTLTLTTNDLYPEMGFNIFPERAAFSAAGNAPRIAVAGTAFRSDGIREGEPLTFAYMTVIDTAGAARLSSQRFDATSEGGLVAIGFAGNGDIIATGRSDGLALVVRTNNSGTLE